MLPTQVTAVVIGNYAVTGNNNPPPGISGWSNVVDVNGASGVYIGNSYVLTAAHVGVPSSININGSPYDTDPAHDVDFSNPNHSTSDLLLIRLTSKPSLPGLFIGDASPSVGALVYVTGFGEVRNGRLTNFGTHDKPIYGFNETGSSGKTWGTNLTVGVDANGNPKMNGAATAFIQPNGANPSVDFFTQFYISETNKADYYHGGNLTSEAQLGPDDSGGAVFDGNGQLIGIDDAVGNQLATDQAVLGDASAYIDLAVYRDQIEEAANIPEPSMRVAFILAAIIAIHRRGRDRTAARQVGINLARY